MPLISIGFDRESKQLLRQLVDALTLEATDNQAIFDELQNLKELIMSEATNVTDKINRLTSEVAQNTALINSLRDMIAAGAADTELANAIRAGIPALDAAITELDANTPEPEPTPEP